MRNYSHTAFFIHCTSTRVTKNHYKYYYYYIYETTILWYNSFTTETARRF